MSAKSNTFTAPELNLLYQTAQVLLDERDYGELLAALLDAAIEAFGAERGFILVREGNGFRASVARNFRSEALAAAEEEVSTSIASSVLERRRALLLGDALTSEFAENPSVQRLALRSVLCAPLVASESAFALLYLENRDISNRFSERQRELLDEICRLAAPRLRTAVAVEDARRRARELEGTLGATEGILTADAAMGRLLQTLPQLAAADLPVLIQGETGTGKELFARALYRRSSRATGPFVVLNCAAIPPTLIESELFGYVQGAFTGATRDRVGLIGAAHRGTLFLDEVGELPLELQSRLLRVLQSGEFNRVGSTRSETADVRFVAATNRDLQREVESGHFRDDLYFRLAAATLQVPPLRDRPHDVHLLADHFLRAYAARYAKPSSQLSPEALAALSSYPFPGNVRELESEMARLVAMTPPGATIAFEALNERVRGAKQRTAPGPADSLPPMSLGEMEKRLILAVLEHTSGNRTRAAEILGISREGLRLKLQRLGLAE